MCWLKQVIFYWCHGNFHWHNFIIWLLHHIFWSPLDSSKTIFKYKIMSMKRARTPLLFTQLVIHWMGYMQLFPYVPILSLSEAKWKKKLICIPKINIYSLLCDNILMNQYVTLFSRWLSHAWLQPMCDCFRSGTQSRHMVIISIPIEVAL